MISVILFLSTCRSSWSTSNACLLYTAKLRKPFTKRPCTSHSLSHRVCYTFACCLVCYDHLLSVLRICSRMTLALKPDCTWGETGFRKWLKFRNNFFLPSRSVFMWSARNLWDVLRLNSNVLAIAVRIGSLLELICQSSSWHTLVIYIIPEFQNSCRLLHSTCNSWCLLQFQYKSSTLNVFFHQNCWPYMLLNNITWPYQACPFWQDP